MERPTGVVEQGRYVGVAQEPGRARTLRETGTTERSDKSRAEWGCEQSECRKGTWLWMTRLLERLPLPPARVVHGYLT